ncbi:hypothetical protein [Aureliella helgolandensis]|uniref:Uncharacterized protein n=1 Tax=Aureliella helgolandensis TaxID=2527968 RepID=A0A518G4H7_9BACT|nr:hypothetical protein [Aureliella helgolandensis]QDV23460.1 hypothetical protein Q31a_17580 [Aureliella helgolandensis]
MRKDVDIRDLLEGFDHERYGVVTRKIVVCCLQQRFDAARGALNEFIQDTQRPTITHESSVHDCVRAQYAVPLDTNGYSTIGSAAKATDEELLWISGFGTGGVAAVRHAAKCIGYGRLDPPPINGEVEEDEITKFIEELKLQMSNLPEAPPRSLQMRQLQGPQPDSSPLSLDAALDRLLGSGEEAIAEIDAKIDRLQSQITRLKQTRRLLQSASANSSRSDKLPDNWQEIEAELVQALKMMGQPMTATSLSQTLDGRATKAVIGEIVNRSSKLDRHSSSKRICLVNA